MELELTGLAFLAVAILAAFVVGKLTNKLRLTSIVGFIAVGVIIGPVTGLVELPTAASEFIVNLTLAFVAFLIGLGFTRRFIKNMGPEVFKITLIESLITSAVVFLAVYIGLRNLPLALILAALAPATAPAGTIAALRETGAGGRF